MQSSLGPWLDPTATRKKFRARVHPGLELTLTSRCRSTSELISDDLPTLERPAKAISGSCAVFSVSSACAVGAEPMNSARLTLGPRFCTFGLRAGIGGQHRRL